MIRVGGVVLRGALSRGYSGKERFGVSYGSALIQMGVAAQTDRSRTSRERKLEIRKRREVV